MIIITSKNIVYKYVYKKWILFLLIQDLSSFKEDIYKNIVLIVLLLKFLLFSYEKQSLCISHNIP